MNKKWKQVLRTGLMVTAGIVLGVQLYLWNAKSLMGNTMPMPFGYGAAVVLSGSMEPTIRVDDLILVKEADSYAVDDIVEYQSGNMLVVHRVTEVGPDTVVTKGDANNAEDAPVRKEMIKGKVIGCLPGMGGAARLMKSPAVSISIAAAALLLSEMGFRKEKQKDEDELEKIKEEIRRLKAEQE